MAVNRKASEAARWLLSIEIISTVSHLPSIYDHEPQKDTVIKYAVFLNPSSVYLVPQTTLLSDTEKLGDTARPGFLPVWVRGEQHPVTSMHT